jgi:hypothetical protein
MKSTATIPHHPKQLLNLLIDSQRRPNFEPNVSVSERLELLNTFTFLDYYAYKGEPDAGLEINLMVVAMRILIHACLSPFKFQLSGP